MAALPQFEQIPSSIGQTDANPTVDGKAALTNEETRRMQIDAHIVALEREIIALKVERNSISSVARLPPEILSRVFIAFASLCPEPLLASNNIHTYYSVAISGRTVQWSVLTEVSQHWREVALGCPQLWSHIAFHKLGWAQLMLQRSKDAPLYISLSEPVLSAAQVHAEHALSQLHRLKDLKVNGQMVQWFKSKIQEMTSPAPILENLDLTAHSAYSVGSSSLPDNFLDNDAPKLQRLSLVGWRLASWETPLLEGLTSLRLSSTVNWAPSASVFMDALEKMPQLAELDLQGVLPNPTAQGSRTVPLAHLRTLHLKAPIQQVAAFLASILITPSAVVSLYCFSSGSKDGDSAAFANLGSAMQSSWLSSPLSVLSAMSISDSTPSSRRSFQSLSLNENTLHGFQLSCYLQRIDFPSRLDQVRTLKLEATTLLDGRGLEEIFKVLPLSGLRTLSMECHIADAALDFLSGLPDIELIHVDGQIAGTLIQYLKDDPAAHPATATGTDDQQEEVSRFCSLKHVSLADTNFDQRNKGSAHTVDLDDLLDMMMIRYELGGEIEMLRIMRALDLDPVDVEQIGEVCVDVDWDGDVHLIMSDDNDDYDPGDYYDSAIDDYDYGGSDYDYDFF